MEPASVLVVEDGRPLRETPLAVLRAGGFEVAWAADGAAAVTELPARTVAHGRVSVDLGAHTVLRDGREVRLSPTEYGLLAELAAHAGEVMPHRTLLQRVWGPTYADERNYLRTFVQRLRAKLEADPAHPEVVVTAGTRGYRFGPPAS